MSPGPMVNVLFFGSGRRQRCLGFEKCLEVRLFAMLLGVSLALQDGDCNSLHFSSDSRETALRCIRRYISQASQRLSNCKTEADERSIEIIKKDFMVVELTMKMNSEWHRKKTVSAGISLFKTSWDNMLVFCKSEPVVQVRCNYMQELNLKVRAQDVQFSGKYLADALAFTSLKENFVGDDKFLCHLQKKYVVLAILTLLEMTAPSSKIASDVVSFLDILMEVRSLLPCQSCRT
jgi:hypothetical protein